jgi:hypothetical protein
MKKAEIIAAVELALRQMSGEFTLDELAAKILEAHPDVDRNALRSAIQNADRFHDAAFEWHELLRQADALSAALDKLRTYAIAALHAGNFDEAYKLKAQYEEKYAVSVELHGRIERMWAAMKEETRRVNEAFKAHPECKTLGDLRRLHVI